MLVGVPLTVDQPLLTGIHPELEVAARVATAVADVKVQLALTIRPPSKPPRDCGNRLADEGEPQEDRALHQRATVQHGGDGARISACDLDTFHHCVAALSP